MSETPERGRQAPQAPDGKAGDLRRWRDLVEEQLSEARERGDFDALEGAGKPLRLDQNVYAGDKALAYSLLKQNKMLPPELERGREIDAELAQAETLLAGLRRRDTMHGKRGPAHASERRAYDVLRDKTRQRYAAAMRAINSKILSLNILVPSPMHRRLLDVERLLADFETEFPRLEG
jgi:DnaJ homolog subfamily C member 28